MRKISRLCWCVALALIFLFALEGCGGAEEPSSGPEGSPGTTQGGKAGKTAPPRPSLLPPGAAPAPSPPTHLPPGATPAPTPPAATTPRGPALTLPPEAAKVLNLGVGHYRQGRYREAAELFAQARDLVPDDPTVSNFLATAYLHGKQYKPSRAEFERMLALQPDSVDPRLGLARIAVRFGDFPEALRLFQEVLEREPSHLVALFNLGRLEYRAGNYEEAAKYITQVLEQEEDHWQARYLLGQTYSRLGQDEDAKREFLKVIELEPRNAQAYFNLSSVYRRLGNEEEAAKVGEIFRQLQNQDYSDRAAEGRAGDKFQKEDYEGALKEFDRLVELNPDHGWYQVARGQCFFKMKKPDEAIAAFEEAARLDPRLPEPYYFLAMLYQGQGEYDKSQRARAEFEKLEAMSDSEKESKF